MSNFNENTRVQVPAALHLCKLGYNYLDSITDYDHRTNILQKVFYESVMRLNPGLDTLGANQLLEKIVSMLDNDDLGREFYNLVSANSGIKLIDFDNPDNNRWHVTTELPCNDDESGDNFRPDITVFINGLPLAFIEVKKPNNNDGILAERNRINRRMRNRRFRRFLNITQLMIFSNNQEYDNENRVPIQGAFYCCASKGDAFFNVFREANANYVTDYNYRTVSEDDENKVLRHRNCIPIKNQPEYHTNKQVTTPTNRILTSMLSKERFLYLLRYGIAYVDKKVELEDGTTSTQLQKHIMRYQQLFASLAIKAKLNAGIKSGIIWHTQGSGKTALAYYSVRSLTDFYAKRNTAAKFYFIVDRIALMEQAVDEFAARGLVVRTASSRDELMNDFRNNRPVVNNEGKPEIMVVNIQKFEEDHHRIDLNNGYNVNLQRVFFIDEAHRGYNPEGSFLANLLEADHDAVKIALTGTPLLKEERESWRVFGDYIDTYYYDKSIADGYTLKLMREPIETIYRERLNNIIDQLSANVQIKKSDFDKDTIIENETYLNALLDYIIDDFRRFRIQQADNSVGAMIVCKTNPQARRLYKLWQERFAMPQSTPENTDISGHMAATTVIPINARTQPLRAALILHDEGDSLERKAYIDEYKKLNTVDVLIVNKMLLTGFDAPRLKRLYLGRKMDGHDLLQALTRVNRPYKDYKYGYVVDFVDIKENFDETNNRYLRELNRTNDPDETGETTPVSYIIEDSEAIISKMRHIKSVLFNFDCENAEEFRRQIDDIDNRDTLYELRSTLTDAKAILNVVRADGDAELKEKVKSLSSGKIPTLLTEVNHRIERLNLIDNTEHKADVSGIINVVLSELVFSFKKGQEEELRIAVNDLRERCERVQAEFNANFDQTEDKYVKLSEEFQRYFREHGYVATTTQELKDRIKYMDGVMLKIREINRRNRTLKEKYRGDEHFVRIHKRIAEENQRRQRPIISQEEYEIAEKLSKMKENIDNALLLNINILENEDHFKRNTLAMVSQTLNTLNVHSDLADRKYINNLIAGEYLAQYNHNYAR
jgi:type I restriction enzyme R subunit